MGDSPVLVEDRSALAAVGRVLGVIGGSGFELQPALDQIASEAAALCRADMAFVFLRDDDVFRFVAASGGTAEHWAYEREHPDTIDRKSVVGRVALSGVAVHVADLAADPEYEASGYRVGGVRSMLGVPIRTADGLIGAFGLGRTRVEPYSDVEIELVTVFADQAGVAIRLARLLTETHEAAEREAAVGRVLAVMGGSEFELQPALDRIAAEAAALCRAEIGFVFLREGELFHFVAASGGTPDHWDYQRAHPFPATRETVVGRVALSNGAVHIHDVLADEEYRWGGQAVGGYRTLLGVPIRTEDGLIGAFGLGRNAVSPFSETEIELVSLFADQAGVAIRLARLLTETHEALERETAVGQVLQSIARSTFDLQGVLDDLIANAVRLSRADEGNLLREDNGRFVVASFTAGVSAEFRRIIGEHPFAPERGSIMGRALLDKRPIHIEDVLADPEYTLAGAQREAGFRTLLGVPLLRDGQPIGVLGVWRTRVYPFTEPEIRLLVTFADQAVLAIENVRLFETVERQRAALASFAPHVAGLLSSPGGETLLAGHRREITALFCDMRGFTAFAEMAEPEELFSVLREYHAAVGKLAIDNGGMVEHFAGDGFMIFFNDPTPVPEHSMAAVRTAIAMRDRFAELAAGWHKRGYDLGLGIGISVGYATLGRIGFEGRYDYAGVGAVTNLAARLSSAAAAGEILISQRMHAAVEDSVTTEPVEGLSLKGFSHAVTAYRVAGLRESATES